MRVLFRIILSFTLLAWCAMAQRGGGHSGGGGFHGSAGSGFSHGSTGGGFRGGSYGAIRGEAIGSGFRGGAGYGGVRNQGYGRGYGGGYGYGGYGRRGFGFRGAYWPYYGWGYPWYGFGFSYWPGSYYGNYDYYPSDNSYPDTYADPAYVYSPSPAATYAPAQADTYAQTIAPATYRGAAHPVTRAYDEYGQETSPASGNASNSSPIYLIAKKDGEIQAAASYWITGQTLHYVTLDRQEKLVTLGLIDGSLTRQLNRERHVSMTLPAQ